MANPEHLAILKQGVEVWNEWRRKQRTPIERVADLSGADLQEMSLREADFRGANLQGANLDHAWLPRADLSAANPQETVFKGHVLRGANLSCATLRGASLESANLSGVDLSGANLYRASMKKASLKGANLDRASFRKAGLSEADLRIAFVADTDFTDSVMDETNLFGLDLSSAKGLDTVDHWGPSHIDIDTIYKSKGRIPEFFLRGCGVPDELIAYIGSMVGRPTDYYSCFISYSTKDQGFADRLYADLRAKGVRCWFAPHDIRGGRKIHEQIDEAIRQYDKLLLILSEDSMASDWVQTEIAKARKREAQEKRQMLFPVALVPYELPREEAEKRRSASEGRPVTILDWECFDADRGKDSAREVREYFIPDFSNWKDHDSYQKAFTRLVADLKAESR